MELKDFKVGQTVYVTQRNSAQESFMTQYRVTSVGRKYIAAEGAAGNSRKFEVWSETDPYLVEHKDFGEKMLLFSDKKAAEAHVEGNALRKWLSKAVDFQKLNRYTIEQLRAVKEILDK